MTGTSMPGAGGEQGGNPLGGRWGEHRLLAIFFDLPIFLKILIANLLVVMVAAGVLVITHQAEVVPKGNLPRTLLALGSILFFAICVNYVLLRVALSPLRLLKQAVDEVLAGNFRARAAVPLFGDPATNRLTETFNRMLDRIEVYTRTIEQERAHSCRLAGRILTSQEEERKRIARELHDETSQILATLMIGLETVHRSMPRNGGASPEQCNKCRVRVESLRGIADQTLEAVHRLAFNLRPSVLDDIGLEQALHWLLREFVERGGLQVEFAADGLQGRFPPEVEIAAFRIVQEACTNILKHARAKNVTVTAVVEDEAIHLLVEDDGTGFSPEEVRKRTREQHLGLVGMEERARLLSGAVEVSSAPGAGTTVRVVLPLAIRAVGEPL